MTGSVTIIGLLDENDIGIFRAFGDRGLSKLDSTLRKLPRISVFTKSSEEPDIGGRCLPANCRVI